MRQYKVNEVFYSLQGEGARAGTANVFVRFSGCNLHCTESLQGFNCDTEHEHVEYVVDGPGLVDLVKEHDRGGCTWVILTGGEPMLQVDTALIDCLHAAGYRIAIETNGTVLVPKQIDYVVISPKPGAVLRQHTADEVKVVLQCDTEIPVYDIEAPHRYLSPASKGTRVHMPAINWCVEQVLKDPWWSLSVQQHKQWGVR